jgi:hypothetical protein
MEIIYINDTKIIYHLRKNPNESYKYIVTYYWFTGGLDSPEGGERILHKKIIQFGKFSTRLHHHKDTTGTGLYSCFDTDDIEGHIKVHTKYAHFLKKDNNHLNPKNWQFWEYHFLYNGL